MSTERTTRTLTLPAEVWNKLKIRAAMDGGTIADAIERMVNFTPLAPTQDVRKGIPKELPKIGNASTPSAGFGASRPAPKPGKK